MKTVKVSKPYKYNVYIGTNIAYRLLERFTFDKVMVVADDNLDQNDINNILNAFPNVYLLKIKASEENKTLDSYIKIIDELIKRGFSKCDYLLAFGGGVVCDLVGYVASTYKRGIKLIMLPTSMLAMVDASVGGKVGINYNGIKNAIGTIYSPELVIIDTYYLHSLPLRHLNNGLMEAYKMGLTLDKGIIEAINDKNYLDVIYYSISAKAKIVDLDYMDNLERHVLNFGHTIGHAFEMVCPIYLHGEAIGASLLFFIKDETLKKQVRNDLSKYFNVDEALKDIINNKELILERIKNDKKVINSTHFFIKEVVLNKIGDYEFVDYSYNDYEGLLNE